MRCDQSVTEALITSRPSDSQLQWEPSGYEDAKRFVAWNQHDWRTACQHETTMFDSGIQAGGYQVLKQSRAIFLVELLDKGN